MKRPKGTWERAGRVCFRMCVSAISPTNGIIYLGVGVRLCLCAYVSLCARGHV